MELWRQQLANRIAIAIINQSKQAKRVRVGEVITFESLGQLNSVCRVCDCDKLANQTTIS
jgi:hypothetical protein